MKIRCERCNARIDTTKHDFCPKCGANFYIDTVPETTKTAEAPIPDYNYNETYSYEPVQPEQKQPDIPAESEADGFDTMMSADTAPLPPQEIHTEKGKKKNGCGSIGCIFLAIFVIGSIIVEIISGIFYTISEVITPQPEPGPYVYSESPEGESEEELPIVVDVGDMVYTEHYTLICDTLTEVDNDILSGTDDYIYIAFGLTLENISKTNACSLEYPECYADGRACSPVLKPDNNYLMMGVELGEICERNVFFGVPADAEYFWLDFGGKIVINIENPFREEE